MSEILLVEDDPVLGRGLSVNLELEGYRVHWATSLRQARELNQKQSLDLVLLDLSLPDGSGLILLKELREKGSRIPVLILTARTDEDSAVEGLQLGANDYIRKPFGDRELLQRIRTALREPVARSAQLRYADLLMLIDERKVFNGKTELELSPREFNILLVLMQNADKVLNRETLVQAVDPNADIYDRSIDSNISHLRARLRQAAVRSVQIRSVYGVGYRLEKA